MARGPDVAQAWCRAYIVKVWHNFLLSVLVKVGRGIVSEVEAKVLSICCVKTAHKHVDEIDPRSEII